MPGKVFEGNFVGGIIEGKGIVRYEDGWCMRVILRREQTRKGKMVVADGSSYEGEFEEGHFHGKGVLCNEG